MTTARKRRRRENLYKRNPKCHWCHCLTVPPKKGESCKSNTATLDHEYPKFDSRRSEHYPGCGERTVLACFSCNQKRSELDHIFFDKRVIAAHKLKVKKEKERRNK